MVVSISSYCSGWTFLSAKALRVCIHINSTLTDSHYQCHLSQRYRGVWLHSSSSQYEEMGASYVTFFPLQIEGCLKSTTLNYTGIRGQHPMDFGRLSVKT